MDDGDGGDDAPLGKQLVERGSSGAPPALLHVAVDSDMTMTTRNPDWCSSNRFPRRLSP